MRSFVRSIRLETLGDHRFAGGPPACPPGGARVDRPGGRRDYRPIGAMAFSGAKLTTVLGSPRATRGQRLKRYCESGRPVEGRACTGSATTTLTVSPSILIEPGGRVELLEGLA